MIKYLLLALLICNVAFSAPVDKKNDGESDALIAKDFDETKSEQLLANEPEHLLSDKDDDDDEPESNALKKEDDDDEPESSELKKEDDDDEPESSELKKEEDDDEPESNELKKEDDEAEADELKSELPKSDEKRQTSNDDEEAEPLKGADNEDEEADEQENKKKRDANAEQLVGDDKDDDDDEDDDKKKREADDKDESDEESEPLISEPEDKEEDKEENKRDADDKNENESESEALTGDDKEDDDDEDDDKKKRDADDKKDDAEPENEPLLADDDDKKAKSEALEKKIESEAEELKLDESKIMAEALKNGDMPEPEAMMMMDPTAVNPMMANMPMPTPMMMDGKVPMGGNQPSPCDVPEFKYYQPHPTDAHKYYQCDPWGTFTERECDDEMIWDRWQLRCDKEENIKNITHMLPAVIRKLSPFNCSLPNFSCKNGGVCTPIDDSDFRCMCPTNFTGDFCELRITETDMSGEIMNGNFSIQDYIKHLVNDNVTMDIKFYEKYKTVLEPAVYEKLMAYLSNYKEAGKIRYDTLINSLVEDVLADIYPDADFLRSFNVSSQNVIATVRLVPNLLSYAKYSSERYNEVFVQYKRVLDHLFTFINETFPKAEEQAEQYAELTRLFLKSTEITNEINETVSRKIPGRNFFNDKASSEKAVIDDIKTDYMDTLDKTYKLFRVLVSFEKAVNDEFKTNPAFVHKTVAQTKLPGSVEFVKLFDDIQSTNIEIWDSLVSYGFWYITNNFINE